MKKLILIMILGIVTMSSASYRTAVVIGQSATYNPSDTNAITLKQRIDACIKYNCAKLWNGTIQKSAIINGASISDRAVKEFVKRGARGALTDLLWMPFLADPNIGTTNPSVSDVILDNAFLYAIWPILSDIESGGF